MKINRHLDPWLPCERPSPTPGHLMRTGGQRLWGAEEGTAGSALAPGESSLVGGVGWKWPLNGHRTLGRLLIGS